MVPFKVDLSDKIVAITGAGGVICSVFARALAHQDASLVAAVVEQNQRCCIARAQGTRTEREIT